MSENKEVQSPSPLDEEVTQLDTTPEVAAELSLPTRITVDIAKQFLAGIRSELVVDDQIGEGSSGIVLRAVDQRLGRDVAIKILHRDWASRLGVDSLTREAQAAALNSDHIVRVYEISPVSSSISYIIMEWIGGPTLRSCLSRFSALPARDAARLTRHIALGLAAAHLRGVIHGDIKPANVMLEPSDSHTPSGTSSASSGESSNVMKLELNQLSNFRAKLADFGLARRADAAVLDPEASVGSDENESNRLHGFAGTPAYASPEQLLSGQPATQATDIWTVGATLYHLLCGVPPYSGRPFAIVSRMESSDPLPPRQIDPRIPRDLESICMKALSRSPAKRYESAQAMADDLQRFLDDLPVLARPISSPSRLLKFIRRRPLVSTLAAGLIVAMLCGTVVSNYFRIRAEENLAMANTNLSRASEERDNAIAVTSLLKGMISSSDAHHGDPNTKVIDALAGLESRISVVLKGKPQIEADVRSNLATMYFSIAGYQQAHDQLVRAISLRSDKKSDSQIYDKIELANVNRWLYKPDEALQQARSALAESEEFLGKGHSTTAYALEVLAGCYKDLGEATEAEKVFIDLLNRNKADQTTLSALGGLSGIYLDLGRYAEAERQIREILSIREKLGLNDTREGIVNQSNLGLALAEQGKIAEAIQQQRECAHRARKVLGPAHDLTVSAWLNYAESLRRSGDSNGAIAINREFMELSRASLGQLHPITLGATEAVIVSMVRRKQCEEALTICDAVIEQADATLAADDDWRFRLLNCQCTALIGLGRPTEALPKFERIIEHYSKIQSGEGKFLLICKNNYGLALVDAGRFDEAVQNYELIVAQASANGENFISRSLGRNYGLALFRAGKVSEARELLEKIKATSVAQGEVENAGKCQEYLDLIAKESTK